MKKGISVILPSYNESVALPLLVEKIQAVFEKSMPKIPYQIVIVDDNSPDGTPNIIRNKFSSDSRVKLVVRKEKGLASAVLRGIREADYEYYITMDCDFNHPPEYIPALVRRIPRYDMVCYSRYVRGGGMNTDNRLFRYWGSRVYNKFLQLYLGIPTNDNLSGYFIARKKETLTLPAEKIFDGYGEFYFGLIYCFYRKKKQQGKRFRIRQLPIVYQMRIGGESKTKFASLMRQYFRKAAKFKRIKL